MTPMFQARPLALAVALIAAAAAPAVHADSDWPRQQPITMVVPYPPGGTMDFIGRLLARELSDALKQTVVVENKAGASGNIGTAFVARAKPDGYTLMVASTSIVIAPSTYKSLSYDVLKMQSLARVGYFYGALAVNPKLPVANVKEFLDLIRKPGSDIKYGSAGIGSTAHLSGALLNSMAHGNMTHVPYKGGAPAVVDTISGQIDLTVGSPLVEVQSYVKAGQLRLLGLTSRNRSPAIPDVPTVGEFLPGYDSTQWAGVYMPGGTPPEIVARLNQIINASLNKPDVKKTLLEAGIEAAGGSAEEFTRFTASELKRWTSIVQDIGLTPN
ncbi:tripartite tricarboxylate transporter substrate binding protein [Pigmentiphaga soli]|uniref:Tripartite tricarboxylate transporter substrate binding protein n=1 Tax=Pigmentiphaga soli TaxID=1007095 RepID=A0ABP8GKU3_9BURK